MFSKDTVPKGLLSRHNTKENTWGLIVVESGSLNYCIYDQNTTTVTLSPGVPGVIEPQVYHKVELLSDDTTFYVEFYAVDGGSVSVPKIIDEKNVQSVAEKEVNKDILRNTIGGSHNGSVNSLVIPLLVLGASGIAYALYAFYKRKQ